MFIHRISITGLSDRGAWPWRSRPAESAFAWFKPARMNRSTACCLSVPNAVRPQPRPGPWL